MKNHYFIEMSDAYRTETRESGTMSFRIEWVYDHDCDPPWDREDGHGPVSDWGMNHD